MVKGSYTVLCPAMQGPERMYFGREERQGGVGCLDAYIIDRITQDERVRREREYGGEPLRISNDRPFQPDGEEAPVQPTRGVVTVDFENVPFGNCGLETIF